MLRYQIRDCGQVEVVERLKPDPASVTYLHLRRSTQGISASVSPEIRVGGEDHVCNARCGRAIESQERERDGSGERE